jgi:hypothetical protein
VIRVLEKTIGGHTYRVSQLGAKSGRIMLLRLIKLVGSGAAAGISSLGSGAAKSIEDLIARGSGDAINELLHRLDEGEVSSILDELAKHTSVVIVEGKESREPLLSDVFDIHFAGAYDEMLAWARFALEVNFGSFFAGSSGFGSAIKSLLLKVKSLSKSPDTSTGTSGASRPVNASAPG